VIDDATLVRQAIDGGPEAFEPIVAKYQDAVFGVALSRLADFHAAEDVAQGVFVEAYRQLGRLRDPHRLGAWLRTITIHHSIELLRKKRETTDADAMARVTDAADGPVDEFHRQDLREQVMAAVARLSGPQRETVTLFYMNGYSQSDVAAIQGVPLGTVKRRLHDARKRLQKEMLTMVEDVLKSESPDEDFATRVFEVLSRYRPRGEKPKMPWREIHAELKRIGSRGADGFARALESPHSPTRILAMSLINRCEADDTREFVIELLKKGLTDTSKKVRRNAVDAILRIDVSDERRRSELTPMVVEMLADPSNRVRRRVAYVLSLYPDGVPWQAVMAAATREWDPQTREFLRWLMLAVLKVDAADSD